MPCAEQDPDLDSCVVVTLDRVGHGRGVLCLVGVDDLPPTGFDPRYAVAAVDFDAECPQDGDCRPQRDRPPGPPDPAVVSYLAKDYASLRLLMLDRLSVVLPAWREQHVPDLGVTLVELLAYAGDQLSYHQDAVATEAYLGTARLRTSVRRHVRLVDYRMHEGCNARAWIAVGTDTDCVLPADVAFATRPGPVRQVFLPMPADERPLWAAHSRMRFHTWGNSRCCLPVGATSAALVSAPEGSPERLRLQVGDVLVMQEVVSPVTGLTEDADRTHRHAVRLCAVRDWTDPVTGDDVVLVAWPAADALPFGLQVSTAGPAPDCAELTDVSVAYGNVLLADHGRWVRDEDLGTVPVVEIRPVCADNPCGCGDIRRAGRFRPTLQEGPVTWREPYAPSDPDDPAAGSAAALMRPQDPRQALPRLRVTTDDAQQPRFTPAVDLLAAGPDDALVVLEPESDGTAYLRFGDGVHGRAPSAGVAATADYRVGNGAEGNVGADSLTAVVFGRTTLQGVRLTPRNPLPAWGGVDPEPIETVRLRAPDAYRRELVRAITADDYATLAGGFPGVQRAAAQLRTTGSGTEVHVAVDTPGGPPDAGLLARVERYLERYRRIGHDVRAVPAREVPIDLAVTVCARPEYFAGHVATAVREVLGSGRLADGRPALFHPDSLTFGDDVRLSRIVAAVADVAGVAGVEVICMARLFGPIDDALDAGVLRLGPLEVAVLDDDPGRPDRGRLGITVEGGR